MRALQDSECAARPAWPSGWKFIQLRDQRVFISDPRQVAFPTMRRWCSKSGAHVRWFEIQNDFPHRSQGRPQHQDERDCACQPAGVPLVNRPDAADAYSARSPITVLRHGSQVATAVGVQQGGHRSGCNYRRWPESNCISGRFRKIANERTGKDGVNPSAGSNAPSSGLIPVAKAAAGRDPLPQAPDHCRSFRSRSRAAAARRIAARPRRVRTLAIRRQSAGLLQRRPNEYPAERVHPRRQCRKSREFETARPRRC